MGETPDGGMMESVLVLGGATPDSIGAGVVSRLEQLGYTAIVPPQSEFDVADSSNDAAWSMLEILSECQPKYVVYSVGVNELDWSWYITKESFDRLMTVNVWGFISVLKMLQLSPHAPYSVLALTSDAAYRPMRTSIAYCASKAALDQAIRVASRELASEGWRINGLAPGKVDGTAMTRYVDERVLSLRGWAPEQAEAYELASSPLGRKISVEEIATVACDVLLSPVLAWTGDIVTVNGGR